MLTEPEARKALRLRWSYMMTRCTNKNRSEYHRYGGRGIKVCERWLAPEVFINDMTASYIKHFEKNGPKNTTLDRIDSNGDYEPSNCRWATMKEQARNTSRNIELSHRGQTKLLQDWALESGLGHNTIIARLNLGWGMEKALKTAPKPTTRKITWGGKTMCIADWAIETGIKYPTLYRRIRTGWPIGKALTEKTNMRLSRT